MRVLVLTTSYPRFEGDPTVTFLREAVECLRERGLEVDVVSPASFRHYGIAYGAGVMGNLRRAPWRGLLVPAMLRNFRNAAREQAAGADLLDVGGESTRPGAEPVPVAEELRRVIPVIEGLRGAGVRVTSSRAAAG